MWYPAHASDEQSICVQGGRDGVRGGSWGQRQPIVWHDQVRPASPAEEVDLDVPICPLYEFGIDESDR